MKEKSIMTAIIGVVLLEAWALWLGFNGVLLTSVVGGLLLLAGIKIKTPKFLGGK